MNSSGYIRGYMAKNMKADKFIKVVADAVSRELKKKLNWREQKEIYSIVFSNIVFYQR